MRPLQFIILLSHNHRTRRNRLPLIIFFIDGVFRQVRLDVIELTQMPTTTALIAQTFLGAMIHKIDLG